MIYTIFDLNCNLSSYKDLSIWFIGQESNNNFFLLLRLLQMYQLYPIHERNKNYNQKIIVLSSTFFEQKNLEIWAFKDGVWTYVKYNIMFKS